MPSNPFIEKVLRRNHHTAFDNTPEDRALIREQVSARLADALSKSTEIIGTKNLVYYTIFCSEDYLNVLELSLKTIAKNSDISKFDVLFITDENFKQKIELFPIISSFSAKFFVRPTARDGVDAAVQKMSIFDYPEINTYSKVLCLDCDIIALKDINSIFDNLNNPEKLEVAMNPSLQYFIVEADKNGQGYFTAEELAVIEEKKIRAFNSGQYAFVNTERMRAHFQNAYWLQYAWPGWFFFEQSLMNNYFMFNDLCSLDALNSCVKFQVAHNIDDRKTSSLSMNNGNAIYKVEVINERQTFIKNIFSVDPSEFTLVHFIGSMLNGSMKLKCMNIFLQEKNLCP